MNQSIYLNRCGLHKSLIMGNQIVKFNCLGMSDGRLSTYLPSVNVGSLEKVDVISCLQDLGSPSVIEIAYSINDKFAVLGTYDFERYTLLNSQLIQLVGVTLSLAVLRVNGTKDRGKYRQTFWVFKQGTPVLNILMSLLR